MNLRKLALAALLLFPASLALAGGARMAEALGLSTEQRGAVEAIMARHKIEGVDAKARAEKARLELEQLMLQDTVDEKAAYKKLAEIDAAMSEVHRTKLAAMLEIKGQLTPEQWQKAVELRQDRHDRDDDRDFGRDDDRDFERDDLR